jgi:hypothetical protein
MPSRPRSGPSATRRAQLEQAQLKRRAAQADSAAARETFDNWLSTRRATQLAEQDTELLSRTRALDTLKDRERAAGVAVEAQQQAALDARQGAARERRKLAELEEPPKCSSMPNTGAWSCVFSCIAWP